jgi:hypothetical protein
MQVILRNLAIAVLAAAGLIFATPAKADAVYNLDLTFTNGASFVGTIDLSNNLHSVTGVNGILYCYENGSTSYMGTGYSDPIETVSNGGIYLLGTLDNITLEDAGWQTTIGIGRFQRTVTDYNTIKLNFNVSNPSDITLILPALSGVNGAELLTGNFSSLNTGENSISPAPEPGTLLLLGSGLVGLAGMVRRKAGRRG